MMGYEDTVNKVNTTSLKATCARSRQLQGLVFGFIRDTKPFTNIRVNGIKGLVVILWSGLWQREVLVRIFACDRQATFVLGGSRNTLVSNVIVCVFMKTWRMTKAESFSVLHCTHLSIYYKQNDHRCHIIQLILITEATCRTLVVIRTPLVSFLL